MAKMRAKLKVTNIRQAGAGPTGAACEELTFGAVYRQSAYPADGTDEDNTFALYTPSADLKMSITNPALVGSFNVGDAFYVDFIPVAPQ